MFKVMRNGVLHSAHETYADACKTARIQSAKDRTGAYDVNEHVGFGVIVKLYRALSGLGVFIPRND